MRRLLAFVRLTRPLFLYGGFAGVALGASVAAWSGRRVDLATYLWVQALVTAFHLMVHYANDYFDRECDADARRTAWSGGSGVLVAGDLHPRVALIAALVCAALGLAVTARFMLAGNVTVAALGIAILVLAWCYSAPPVRFAARGLGEIDTALVVAVLVPCAGYAAFSGRIDDPIITAVTAPAGAMLAMMLCVELPDAGVDFLAGKRNLVVRWGTARALQLITIAAIFTVMTAVGSALRMHAGLIMLALAPAAVSAIVLVRRTTGDPRPASIALWGVALYATTLTGLAALYALLAVLAAR
ncbi:MAG: 1,4-dihydroxy-2-naphthoate polyprenyltransferase [Candidatus Eremiobacteraeota bacterium]|nr:1,4-dihydroxy-2-naphthoate polyprenyltransferase [Candidatus Eremiobacteraeota bacterium]